MSVPELRRLLNEARAEIRELQKRPIEAVIERVEVRVEVPVDRVVTVYRDAPVPERITERLIENPDHIETIRMLQARIAQLTGD